MITAFAQNWWTFTLRGLFAPLFGVLAFVAPGATLATLIFVFAFYAILNGILAWSYPALVDTRRLGDMRIQA